MATKVKKKSRKSVVAAGPGARKRAKPAPKAAAKPASKARPRKPAPAVANPAPSLAAPKPARRAPAVRQASRSERSYAMKP